MKVEKLSFPAEVVFVRLMLKADDYGSFYAHPSLVKSNLFPHRADKLRNDDVARWIAEIEKAGIIFCYEVEQKQYLRIRDFNQKLKHGMKAKFPHPPEVEIEDEVEEKRREEKKPAIPSIEEFLAYGREVLLDKYAAHEEPLRVKYETWVDDGWKDGFKNPIKNWKLKVRTIIPYLKPTNGTRKSIEPANQNSDFGTL